VILRAAQNDRLVFKRNIDAWIPACAGMTTFKKFLKAKS
jgi:hypothetical protein